MSDELVYEWYREALAADDREAVLRAAGTFRSAVEVLLRSHDQDDAFLETPACERLATRLPGTRIARYELVRKIGSGGGGRVYEALQEQPRRRVALKLLRVVQDRFEQEAEVLARLDHPGIAAVYEAGRAEGVAYLALQLVEGTTLREWSTGRRLGERLGVLIRVCEAVQHGHARQVIHRDLKPENVLVGDAGPKVIDFGIAAVEGEGTGVAGTPGYMAPEQARGGSVDARADVYALGAMLRELIEVAPEKAATSPDLRAIVEKALELRPEDRYPTAAALANDLQRYLRHEPVSVRSAGYLHHLRLFVRRRPALALATSALLVAVAVGLTTSLSLAVAASRQRDAALTANEALALEVYVGQIALAQGALRRHDVVEARRRLEAAPVHLRGWEWRHLRPRLVQSQRVIDAGIPMFAGAACPTSGRLVAVGEAGAGVGALVRVDLLGGDVATWRFEQTQPLCVALSPEGRRAAIGTSDGRILMVDVETGRVLFTCREANTHVNAVRFAPEGDRIVGACRDQTARVWDAQHGRLLHAYPEHADRVICATFLPGGGILTGCRDGTICRFAPGEAPHRWEAHAGSVEDVALSPTGLEVASVSRDRTIRTWSVADGTPLGVAFGHEDNVRGVAWAGSRIATVSYDRTVRFWRADDLRPIVTLRGHENLVRQVAFVDGEQVASFSPDGTIRLWSSTAPGDATELRDVGAGVLHLGFGDAGLLASMADGRFLLWDGAGEPRAIRPAAGVAETFFIAGGALHMRLRSGRIVSHGDASEPQVHVEKSSGPFGWDPASHTLYWTSGSRIYGKQSGSRARYAFGLHAPIRALVAGPEAGLLAAVDAAGDLGVWTDGQEDARRRLPLRGACAFAASPDGALLAVGHRNGVLLLLRRRDLSTLHHLEGHAGPVSALAFHPTEPRLASGSLDETVRLWDTGAGAQVAVLHAGIRVRTVAFDAPGRRLAAGGGGETGTQILVWEAQD